MNLRFVLPLHVLVLDVELFSGTALFEIVLFSIHASNNYYAFMGCSQHTFITTCIVHMHTWVGLLV